MYRSICVFWVCTCLIFTASVKYVFAAGDMCPVAKEFSAKAALQFKEDPKKALAGLLQAHNWCPSNEKISYNLGLGYYKYKRPDKAYEVWSELYQHSPHNSKLINNLGWLAYKLGKDDEALTWAGKSGKTKSSAILTMEVLFRKGRYEKALKYASSKATLLGSANVDKAAGYLVDKKWQVFRSGDREGATKSLIDMSRTYPQSGIIAEAKEKMILAMWDDSVDIPLPKPLPDNVLVVPASGNDISSGSSEVLAIGSHKQTAPATDKAYAVLIGIRKYQTINGPRFADNDARQVQRLLTRMGGFKNDSAHIKLLINRDATLGNILNNIAWLERKARLNPDAKIVFYFSGHGSPVLGEDKTTIRDGLLIPYEANLDGLSDRTAISMAELDSRFSKIKNNQMITIIDACFSGSGKSASGMKLIKPRVKKNLVSKSKQFITASAADRPAEEYAPGRQGAFSYFFLKALMGQGDLNNDGWVDSVEAFNYAKSKLSALDLEQSPEMTSKEPLKISRIK
ncbi:caspase family protein [Maridesulfovibrio bastinii]|uniref:caspase family protein n=1 Tax=Maridesulfovibrio bastinii TaxID=47157 RepID=UPI000403E3E8|nr:caspase family protein [Maridesulfovibrio bastinii]